MSQALLTPSTETEIPASRIMRERDQAKAEVERLLDERAATADRHAEARRGWLRQLAKVENELRDTRLDLRIASDERDHYRDVAKGHRERAERDVADRLASADRAIKNLSGECADLRSLLVEVLKHDAVGETCPECGGWDDVRDEPTDCAACFEGRVVRS